MKRKLFITVAGLIFFILSNSCYAQTDYHEPHRPQIHFSPREHWMNDPNGMVYYNGIYNLFFQYYPKGNVWGPMHWGHAISKDLIHWAEQPIALYPDSLGYIFSGSAVVDVNNTSGLGQNGKPPLVAVFTQHDPEGEKAGTTTFQNQSIAYSNDAGKTWVKYKNNPVLKNPGIKDFRDPKVSWYENEKKWIMTLATYDRITFFSSKDLRNWTKESEFGKDKGAHGGVWECPDLVPIIYQDKEVWVLLVSINPGSPHGGSATQYFIGQFDGHAFTSSQTETKWIDDGADDYAGVTWSNTGKRKIFFGWMSNWQYGTKVPTEKWRSAMTIPRELSLEKINGNYFLRSLPITELSAISVKQTNLTGEIQKDISYNGPIKLQLDLTLLDDFTIELKNIKNERCMIGYE
ncbi:MAG TPA: glycoside hydrolase family 32 protein, partial [Chitinophagaceae bacterium]